MQKLLTFFNVSKLFVFLNYAALFIGILNSYLRPKLFSKYFSEQDFAFLTIVYGIAVYISFLDGGISKPLYVSLREKFIKKNEDVSKFITETFSFYIALFFVVLIIFSAALLIIYGNFENSLSGILIILLGFNISVNFQVSNFKNILIAVDEFVFFQKIEFFRRFSNLLAICSLVIDKTFIFGMILSNIIILFLLYILKQRLNKKYKLKNDFFSVRLAELKSFYKRYFKQSKNYFLFTVFEILIYNSGFIIIPFFYNDFDIIQYGLLITIFNGVSILSRAIIDISIHEMTKQYIEREFKTSKRIFNYSFIITLVINIALFLIFKFFSEFIFEVWVGEKYLFTPFMNLALLIMLIANSMQHVSGTLLVSVKDNFNNVKLKSGIILCFILLVQSLVIIFKGNTSHFYLMTSIVYFFGAISYFYSAKALYKLTD